MRADRLFSFRTACGTYLGRLAKKHPKHIEQMRDRTRRWWVIEPALLSNNTPSVTPSCDTL
jgi:hypothetical protein